MSCSKNFLFDEDVVCLMFIDFVFWIVDIEDGRFRSLFVIFVDKYFSRNGDIVCGVWEIEI